MSAYVSDWSQEVYGDCRRYAVPGVDARRPRRDYLDDYLQHALVALARRPADDRARRAASSQRR